MKENKLLESELSVKGFKLQSLNLHDNILKDKKAFGIVQYQWFDKGSLKLVVRTGLKKDILVTDQYNENYKRLLLKSVVDKRVPFYIDKKELENGSYGNSGYGFMYSLRDRELKNIGHEGIRFGLWPKGVKSYEPVTRTVIECNFLYSEKKGTFFSGVNNVEFFLPKGESLSYYSRYLDRRRYYSLMKSLKTLLNVIILNIRSISLEGIVKLSEGDQEKLLKRVMLVEWLVVTRINGLLALLDNDSWVWRHNIYYLQAYVNELVKYLGTIKYLLKSLIKLNLSETEKKVLLYSLSKGQADKIQEDKNIVYWNSMCSALKYYGSSDLNKKYFIGFMNGVLKSSVEKELLKMDCNLDLSKDGGNVRMHLVSSLDHFFRKSVVSVRSMRKLHTKLCGLTKVKAITGLLFESSRGTHKDIYSVESVKSKSRRGFKINN